MTKEASLLDEGDAEEEEESDSGSDADEEEDEDSDGWGEEEEAQVEEEEAGEKDWDIRKTQALSPDGKGRARPIPLLGRAVIFAKS